MMLKFTDETGNYFIDTPQGAAKRLGLDISDLLPECAEAAERRGVVDLPSVPGLVISWCQSTR